jgi:hypothetical protein
MFSFYNLPVPPLEFFHPQLPALQKALTGREEEDLCQEFDKLSLSTNCPAPFYFPSF